MYMTLPEGVKPIDRAGGTSFLAMIAQVTRVVGSVANCEIDKLLTLLEVTRLHKTVRRDRENSQFKKQIWSSDTMKHVGQHGSMIDHSDECVYL